MQSEGHLRIIAMRFNHSGACGGGVSAPPSIRIIGRVGATIDMKIIKLYDQGM